MKQTKILIAYYSKTGNTRKIAHLLAEKLKADLDEITDLTDRSGIKGWLYGGRDAMKSKLTEIKYSKSPKDYDLVIVGTPVWAWNSTPAVITYLTNNKNNLKNVAIFNTSGGTAAEKTANYLQGFLNNKIRAWEGWTEKELHMGMIEEKLENFIKTIRNG